MRPYMSENQLFDHWLSQKSQEILSKIDKEKVTTEDRLILTLKAQTNHFHHMDVEFRDEFKKIDERFNKIDHKFDDKFNGLESKMDKKFERMYNFLIWGFGLMITSIFGLYLKMYLH